MPQDWFDALKSAAPPPKRPAAEPGKKPLDWFELHQPNRVEMRPEEQQLVETDWFARVAAGKPGQIPIPSVEVGDGAAGLPQGPVPMGQAARPELADALPPRTTSGGAAAFGKDLAVTTANAFLSIPETLIGLQNLSTFGLAGKAYDSVGLKPTDWKKYLSQFYSEGHKAKLKNIADAKGIIDTAIRVLQNPAVVGHAVVESLPSMWTGGKVGQGILWGANKLAARQGGVAATRAGNKILEMLTGKYGGAIAGGLGEGVVTAGQSAESIRAQTPDRSLSAGQAALVVGSGALTGFIGALGGSMAEKLGFDDVNTMMAAGFANRVARKNLARGLILGGIQEGPEEYFQSYQEQMANNLALGKDPWEGVDEASVLGFFAGVVMSGGAQMTGAARNDLRFRGQVKGVASGLEAAMEQPLTDTRPRLVEKARVAPSDRALKRGIDPITRALEETLTAPTGDGKPTLVRPEWSRNQDIEADVDTRVATAAAFEELLRRGQFAPLVANDPSLLKAAKLAASGYKGLPVQIGSLPNGAVLLENDGTADQTDWTIVRENTPTGPTVMAYDEKGTILELGVNGQAGKDLAGVLKDIVSGKSRIDRPAPPSAPPGAPPTAPAAPGTTTPPEAAQPVEPAPVAPAVESAAAPAEPVAEAPGAPVQVKPMTEAEFLQQLEAAMTGQPPAAAPPAAPTPHVVHPPGRHEMGTDLGPAPAGGVPMMITRTMRLQLKKLGHTDEAIDKMLPAEAWQLLEAERAKAVPPAAPAAPPAAPEAPAAPAAPATPVDPAEAARNALAQALLDAAANLTGKPVEPTPAAPPAAPVTPPAPKPATPVPPAATPPAAPKAKPFKVGDAVLHADGRRGLVTKVAKLGDALDGEYSVDVSWDDGGKTGKLVGGIHGMPENWTKLDEADAQPPEAPAKEEPREPTQLPAGKTRVSPPDDRAVEKARARRQRREEAREERARKDADVDEAALIKADNNRRFAEVLAFARQNGYTGDEAELRAKFDVLIVLGRAAVEDYAENRSENDEGRSLMEAIAANGGIGYDPQSEERGEVDNLWSLADPGFGLVEGKTWTKGGKVSKAQPRKLPKARIFKVWGVLRNGHDKGPEAFRKWGLSLDHMATALHSDGWNDIYDPNSLYQAIEDAVINAKKQARGGEKGADDPAMAVGMKEVGWWDHDYDKDGRRLIADPILEPTPKPDWSKASDDELRAMYDLVKDLVPDQTWPAHDLEEHESVMAEAKKRGLIEEPAAPLSPEDQRQQEVEAGLARLEKLPIEQVVAEANELIALLEPPAPSRKERDKILDDLEIYESFLEEREDVFIQDDGRYRVGKDPDRGTPKPWVEPEPPPPPAPTKPTRPPTKAPGGTFVPPNVPKGLIGDTENAENIRTQWPRLISYLAKLGYELKKKTGGKLSISVDGKTFGLSFNDMGHLTPYRWNGANATGREVKQLKEDLKAFENAIMAFRPSTVQHIADSINGKVRDDRLTDQQMREIVEHINQQRDGKGPIDPVEYIELSARLAAYDQASQDREKEGSDVRIPDEILPPEEKKKPAGTELGPPRKPPTPAILKLRPLDQVIKEANLLVDRLDDARILDPTVDADKVVPLLLHYEVFLHTVPEVMQDEAGQWVRKPPTNPAKKPTAAKKVAEKAERQAPTGRVMEKVRMAHAESLRDGRLRLIDSETAQVSTVVKNHGDAWVVNGDGNLAWWPADKGSADAPLSGVTLEGTRLTDQPPASPEEAAQILKEAGEKLKKQPTFDMPPLTLSGEVGPTGTKQGSIFDLSPEAREKLDVIERERERLFRELGKKANEAQTGFDPAIGKLSFQLLKTYTDAGFVRFADVVQKLIEKLGAQPTAQFAEYFDRGWKILTGQDANTIATMKAIAKDAKKTDPEAKKEQTQKEKLEGYTGPVTASALLTGDNVQLLRLHGLEPTGLPDGHILLTGRTYDFQTIIRESGGKQATHFGTTYYDVSPDGLRRILIHLAGLPRPRRRPSAPDAHYLGDSRFSRLRKDADGRPDESGVDGDPREGLLPDTRALLEKGLAKGIPQHIIDEQIEDAVRIIQAWDRERKLFLLASDPGSGKTFVLGAVMKELLHRGVKNIVYVTKNQDLISQITKKDLKAFGIDKVTFITYQGMLEMLPEPTDVFILDESHSAKNVADQKKTAVLAGQWMEKSAFPILASATPFENPVQAAYLAASGIFDQEFQGWESFAFAFGASPQIIRQKDGKGKTKSELLPVWKTTKTNEEDAAAARTWFLKKGVYTSRRIRLPEGMVDSRLVQIDVPDTEALTFAAMADAAAENEDNIKGWQAKAWRVNFFKRLLEASKITTAIKEADAAMKRGRFPVIFIETKAARKYDIPDLIRREEAFKEAQAAGLKPKRRDKAYMLPPAGIVDMFKTFMEGGNGSEINIPPATQLIRDYFGHTRTMIYTGEVSKLKASANLEAWRNAKAPAVLVATMAKGGTGLSLHDEEGNHPTTQINVNLPWTGTQVLQVTQRTARYGLQSKAEIQWLFAGNIFFDQVLARRVGKRMADLGASVHGRPPGEAGKIENWDLEDVPFSEINKLNRLQGKDDPSVGDMTTGEINDDDDADEDAVDAPADEELASTTSEVGDRRRGVAAEGEILRSAPQGKRGSVEPPAGAFNIPGVAPTGEQLVRIPLPELVELARELSASLGKDAPPIIREKMGNSLGLFRTGQNRFGVEIKAELFKPGKERELAAALAHEIGHFTDYVPDKTVKRGRILGHILTLQQFMAQSFTRPDGTVVHEADVLKELKKLSLLWRPWDRATASKAFTEYRDSAVELYADALSALYNSPGLVQKTAPIFYNEFFEYLDRKPVAKAAYFDLQARLWRIEDVLERYQRRMTQMHDVGNTKAVDLQKMRLEKAKLTRKSFWMQLRATLVDRDVPFQDRVREAVKLGKVILAEKNPVFKAEERRQVAAKQKRWVEMFVQPMYEGIKKLDIRWSEFGKKVMYERVLYGDRPDKGNPRGTDPERARLALDDLHRIWGPQKTAEVDMLLEHFRDGMMEVFEEAYTRGELYTPKQWEKYKENRYYATFWVLDHLASSMSAQMYHQVGTFKDILNAVDATVAKMLVTIRATEDMETRRAMADFLLTNFREDIEEATAHYDTRLQTRVPDRPTAEARDRGHGELVLVKRQGKTVGYWVDPWIAKSWNEWSIDRRNIYLTVLRKFTGPLRALFITYNVGFQAYNLFRDFYRFWKNVPKMSLGRAFKLYYQALPIAKVRAFGMGKNPKAWELVAQDFIHEGERAAMLGITYNELHDVGNLSDENIENVMSRSHVPGYAPVKNRPKLLSPLLDLLAAIKQTGDLIETLPKAAGIIHFKGNGSIADIPPDVRSFIRRKVGSPDFTTAPLYKAVTNEIFLFSNAIIQAVRSDIEVMTDPKTAAGYWMKTLAVNLIPKLFMIAASMGLMGEALRRMMAGVSEYKKTNYITIPLNEDAKGNVTTLQIPQDDMGRLIGGLLWKGFGLVRGRTDVMQTLQALADYSAGQLPSVTPVLGAAADIATYAVGANPYDPFRGRNVLTDQEQAARGVPALKKFVGYEFQQLGGNIIYKWYNNEPYPKETTWGQTIINLPLSGNLVGRFVTIGQSGRAEEARMAARGAARTEAQKGLQERDLVYDTLRDRIGRGQRQPTSDMADAMARNLARQLYPGDRAAQEDRRDNIKRRLQMGFKRGGADAFADAVLNAPSVAQKVSVLQEVRRQKGVAAFPTWLRHARQTGIVSDATYKAFMQGRVGAR